MLKNVFFVFRFSESEQFEFWFGGQPSRTMAWPLSQAKHGRQTTGYGI